MTASAQSRAFYRSPFWRQLRAEALQRDGWRCVVPGCGDRASFVDHIATRPRSAAPTAADTLDNLRSLCAYHDAQAKERPGGGRSNGGGFKLRGCDSDGWPLDINARGD